MNFPNATEVLSELVAIPSVSSVSPRFDLPNRAVIERLANYFDGFGWSTDILALPHAPGKANLIARLGEGEGGLVLAGHTDTVPCDDGDWSSDPFVLDERDGRLHGLGATDMKGFLAIVVALAPRVDPKRLAVPLYVVATADEESGMDGARLLEALGRPRADYCVIGEPTDLVPVARHKGVMMEALSIEGGAGHASEPESAPNAIDGLVRVLGALSAWREELKSRAHDEAFSVPYPTLNFGHVHGGDNPNRICAHVELHIDIRFLPGMRLEALREAIDERVRLALAGTGCRFTRRSLFPGIEAFENRTRGRLLPLVEQLSGSPARAVSFGTEAGFFTAMGMEAVVWGPGRIDEAHKPNEYIELAAFARSEALIESLIARLLYY